MDSKVPQILKIIVYGVGQMLLFLKSLGFFSHKRKLHIEHSFPINGISIDLQAFQELQEKMIETTQRVKVAEGQILQLRRNMAHSKLTDQELASLPSHTPTYEAVGRM